MREGQPSQNDNYGQYSVCIRQQALRGRVSLAGAQWRQERAWSEVASVASSASLRILASPQAEVDHCSGP